MKKILGFIFILGGIGLGAYLCLYLMLYGGICQIIDSINPVVAKGIALGIIKVLCCELGVMPGYILVYLGIYLVYGD